MHQIDMHAHKHQQVEHTDSASDANQLFQVPQHKHGGSRQLSLSFKQACLTLLLGQQKLAPPAIFTPCGSMPLTE
jgi:hypothetical protein